MSNQKSLPPDVEEDLAQTAGVLVRSGILETVKLEEILKKIAKEMNLPIVHWKILDDPDWLSDFKNRWFHKLFPGERHFTDFARSSWQNQLNKKDERYRNAFPLPKRSNLKIARINPTVIRDEDSLPSDFLHKDIQHKEPHLSLSTRKPWRTSDLHETASTNREISNDFLTEDVKKKAQMGLRIHAKPIERFNYGRSTQNQKKAVRRPEGPLHCLQDKCSVFENPSGSRESNRIMNENHDGKQKEGTLIKQSSGGKRKRNHAGKMLDSGEESSGSSTSIVVSPVKKNSASEKKKKRRMKCSKESIPDKESPNSTKSTAVVVNSKESVSNKKDNLELVRSGLKKLEDLCLACGTMENVTAKHPLFLGGLCQEHKLLMHESFFQYDDDGYHSVCSVCCMGNKVVLCDIHDCVRCYCKDCLNTLSHTDCFDAAVKSDHWVCNFCMETRDPQDLLVRRPEWKEEIQRLYQNTGESRYSAFLVPPPIPVQSRRPIRVLSLFDGIATGIVALKQLGLQIKTFVASEIDEDAIRLVQNKHSEVTHIGDVTKITDEEIYKMGPFDLLLGGSPCNDLSGANPRRRGLLDAEGSGCLFFDFYRILRTIEPPKCRDGGYKRPFFWLFENVVSMKGIEKERISRFLQCEPKMADARYVSAAARPRLFWGNLPGLRDRKIVPVAKDLLTVQECLERNRTAQVEKLNTITTKYTCLYQGVTRRAPVLHNGKEDVLWTTELERVFGVPQHYTDVNNLGPRERLALLGRSWSVPVVRLLLAPLKEYFSGVQQVPEGQKYANGNRWK